MIVAFSVAPSGVGPKGHDNPDASVHDAVAAAVRVVRESGLPNRTDSMFTSIEGEWDEVMAVVTACFEAMRADCPRVEVALKVDYRAGDGSRLASKVAAVEERLGRKLATG